MANHTWAQGGDSKESEISHGLVSPARRALKKLTLARFWPEKAHIRPVPKTGDWFSRFRSFHGSPTWPINWPACLSHRNSKMNEFRWGGEEVIRDPGIDIHLDLN